MQWDNSYLLHASYILINPDGSKNKQQPQTILKIRKQPSIFILVMEDRYISGVKKIKNRRLDKRDHGKIYSLTGT